MAFLDELELHLSAGKGGDGVVRWRREKFVSKGGPAGGDGGQGGDVFVRAVRGVRVLNRYRHQKSYRAEDGAPGGSKKLHGGSGADLYLELPVGSRIERRDTGEVVELEQEGQTVKLLRGGRGGKGNEFFKSSTNQSPRESSPGLPGEEGVFFIEVVLVAEVGLIGLPNAGKSSLLNALTAARAKVGDYPFTTLDPNLGDLYGYTIADIPGLIEGASQGKGLGHKFLKHIRRTEILAHLVSFENKNMMKAYQEVRGELAQFDPTLLEKEEIILLSKCDTVEAPARDAILKQFQKLKKPIYPISLFDDQSVKAFQNHLVSLLKK